MKKIVLILIICSIWFACAHNGAESIADYFPADDEVPGWSRADTVRAYIGDDLFILINGGAELYHANGFIQVAIQSFKDSGGNLIAVEIYKMSSVDGAVKTYDSKVSTSATRVKIGDAASLSSYYLNFRQDRHLVTLVGFNESDETIEGLTELAQAISSKID